MAARIAAALGAAGWDLALVGEAFGEDAAELVRRVLEAVVIALALAGQQDVHDVVEVVSPLRVEFRRAAEQRGAVELVFGDERDLAAGLDLATGDAGQVDEEVFFRDRADGVEPEAIETEFIEPIDRVLDEEIADFGAAEVDGRTPRCL